MNQSETNATGTGAGSDGARKLVSFYAADQCYAFDMQVVREIIRVPDTVRVPLTPLGLMGIANLRGAVLPVIDLRSALDLPSQDYNDATRVVVTDSGFLVGLVVDRISKVMEVDSGQIEEDVEHQALVNTELLSGVIHEGDSLIQLLEVDRLIEAEMKDASTAKKEPRTSGRSMQDCGERGEGEDDNVQMVSFLLDEQEYALMIKDVQEIIRIPDEISRVPRAEDHVLGLIDLRGRLLPLVSLRRMFAMEQAPISEHNRVLVVCPDAALGQAKGLGVVVDQVREVLRVKRNEMDAVPGLLNSEASGVEIESVCQLEDGKRLVSVLSAGNLFEDSGVQKVMKADTGEVTMWKNNEKAISHEEDVQLVVFQLNGQEYGVMIDTVQEITRVPDEISRVPRTPDFVEGMVNLRGTVLPVLDMRSRFGLPRQDRNDRQRILVFNLGGLRTGFIMDAVTEVLRIERDMIEDAPVLSSDQAKIMGKVVNLKDQGRMIQVIDEKELLDRAELQVLKKDCVNAEEEVIQA